jgi:ubiquinone/menaquinone biosynthesis C-methylase UbiE
MQRVERSWLAAMRRELLSPLSGYVLEVGAGTGVNLPLYASSAQVLACEPSAPLLAIARQKWSSMERPPQMTFVQAGVLDAAFTDRCKPDSFDAAVCTLVLCTVPRPEEVLDSLFNWLKPGGQLLVIEHVQPGHWVKKACFRALQPLWGVLAEGCQLSRPTRQLILQAGFSPLWEKNFDRGIPFLQAVYQKP